MSTAMTTVRAVKDLYPPMATTELWDCLRQLATDERDDKGFFILRRQLTLPEKQALHQRLAVLDPWLAAARHREVVSTVAQMLMGFGGKAHSTMEAAAVTATQYATALAPLPLWAIERACMRFATGMVKADEIGEKEIDRSFAPSSAQLAIVAREMVRPWGEERTRIYLTVNGQPRRRPMSDAQREESSKRVGAMLDEFKGRIGPTEDEFMEEEARLRERSAENMKRARAAIIDEYVRAGLDPPADRPGKVLVSLPMMLKRGYTIREVDGKNVLVGYGSERDR